MHPFECHDNCRFKYDDIGVGPKNLVLMKDKNYIDVVKYEIIESKRHYELVCEGRLEIGLGEA